MENTLSKQNKGFFKDGTLTINLYVLTVVLIISIFFVPDYIGILFLNVQRICLLLMWYLIFRNLEHRKDFISTTLNVKINLLIFIYILILFVTAVYRRNLNTILNPLFDQIAIFYTVYYIFKRGFPVQKLLSLLTHITYILCTMGIFEYITKFSIFTKFQMIGGLTDGEYIRGGAYRILGPAHHPLGYGLFLIIMLGIICYKQNKGLNILNRPMGVLLIFLNAVFTGSRSTAGIILLEIFLITVFSTNKQKKETLIIIGLSVGALVSVIIMFFNTGIVQSIIAKFSLIVDAVFDTDIAQQFGVEGLTTYQNSENYRKLLPLIFKLDWLSPIIGRGYGYNFQWFYDGFYINSIDNYYINQYIRVAYPGLIVQILIYLYFFWQMIKLAFFKKQALAMAFLMGLTCYFVNLYWVDSLGTLDYIFFIFGVIYFDVILKS